MDAAAMRAQGDDVWLRAGRDVIRHEAQALLHLAEGLDGEFGRALQLLLACRGAVIVSGIGKAGLIGQKLTASLASTGTRAHFLHPAEAMHGDLGRVHADDVVLILSQSGETEEVVRLLPHLARLGAPLIAVTCRPNSTLGQAATVTLDLGPLEEACPHGLAPTTTTTAMLAMGDALALVTSQRRGFAPHDFARYHPGGSLGRLLATVDDVMRPLAECRVARDGDAVRDVLVGTGHVGRRTGAIMLVDDSGALTGLFTDSDFARLFAATQQSDLEQRLAGPMSAVMTCRPTTLLAGTPARRAVELMAERKFSELPVVDMQRRPLGLIDITDVVGLGSAAGAASVAPSASSTDAESPDVLDGTPPALNARRRLDPPQTTSRAGKVGPTGTAAMAPPSNSPASAGDKGTTPPSKP